RQLLVDPDLDVQRAALASATRRPNRSLVDVLLPLLPQPELSDDAREALAAVGPPAVPELVRQLAASRAPRAEVLLVRALGRIASPRALKALFRLVRASD